MWFQYMRGDYRHITFSPQKILCDDANFVTMFNTNQDSSFPFTLDVTSGVVHFLFKSPLPLHRRDGFHASEEVVRMVFGEIPPKAYTLTIGNTSSNIAGNESLNKSRSPSGGWMIGFGHWHWRLRQSWAEKPMYLKPKLIYYDLKPKIETFWFQYIRSVVEPTKYYFKENTFIEEFNKNRSLHKIVVGEYNHYLYFIFLGGMSSHYTDTYGLRLNSSIARFLFGDLVFSASQPVTVTHSAGNIVDKGPAAVESMAICNSERRYPSDDYVIENIDSLDSRRNGWKAKIVDTFIPREIRGTSMNCFQYIDNGVPIGPLYTVYDDFINHFNTNRPTNYQIQLFVFFYIYQRIIYNYNLIYKYQLYTTGEYQIQILKNIALNTTSPFWNTIYITIPQKV